MAVPANAVPFQRHVAPAPELAAEITEARTLPLSTWHRFRGNRLSYYSLLILATAFFISLFAEFLSNEKPVVVRYDGEIRFPILHEYSELDYGGVLRTPAIYHDPYIQEQLAKPGNWALFPPNQWDYRTMNYWTQESHPFPPSRSNWLGTDIIGRDVFARLLYAFRLSILFALSLTVAGTVIGVFLGAVQGYFGGKVDLAIQRLTEVWGSLPELYLLIIFASFFEPTLVLLFCLLSLFGWMLLADYVRAEFLRNRQLEYVKAARAMGLSHGQIIWRHILPNSLVPVITFLPFRMSAAIMALTSLDFLGLGVKAPTPSFGDLLAQGKAYLYAWWISVPAFLVLVSTLLLLTFIGEGLRDALDARRVRNNLRRS